MTLDDVKYGNPTIEHLAMLEKETFVDALFPHISTFTFPKNSSDATISELNEIVECINLLSVKEEYINRYKFYDRALIKYFKDGLEKGDIDMHEANALIDGVIADTLPLLIKLKYHFQRPRPFQLAEYYKLKLFPFKSYSADSPSFPSGHSFQAKLLTEVIGNRYPSTYAFMKDVCNDINYSRLYMGLHYQSDIDVGIFAAEQVLQMDEFKQKYKL